MPAVTDTTATTHAKTNGSVSTTAFGLSTGTAKARAIAAEEQRVNGILANASNVNGSTGYESPDASVVNRTSAGVYVGVTVFYSYKYNCSNSSGVVDNAETRTVYLVTDDATRLVEVERGVDLICGDPG